MSAKKKQEFQTTREIERNEKVKFETSEKINQIFSEKSKALVCSKFGVKIATKFSSSFCLVISSTFKVLPFHSKMSEVMTPKQIAKSLKVFANLIELLT